MQRFKFNNIQLVVRAPTGVEMFVVDGSMRRIASGIGRLEHSVSPGVYKIRFRMSNVQHDEFVVVTGDKDVVELEAPNMQHRTAIPFMAVESSDSPISNIASERAQQIDRSLGDRQSQLFVFVYDSSRPARTKSQSRVSIADADGNQVIGLDDPVEFDLGEYVAVNVAVPEGTYRVRVWDPTVGNFEVFVTTVRGWQSQIFLRYADFVVASETYRCPSLNQAGILMSREGIGFDPQSETARLTDIALHAMVQKRTQLAEAVLTDILYEKFGDPLLGVFGAHLLLMQRHPDQRLLYTVCDNLLRLMPNHPDVRVLWSQSGVEEGRKIRSILQPPMLRASWEMLINATRRRASLVPAGSLAATVAQNSIAGHPWLLHKFGVLGQERVRGKVSIAEAERITSQFLEMEPSELGSIIEIARESGETFTGLEENVLHNVLFEPIVFRSEKSGDEIQLDLARADVGVGSPTARQVISQIDAPSYAIAQSVQSIANKLRVQ